MATEGIATEISFGTSNFSANLLSVDGPNIERAVIDSTHMETENAMTKILAALYDAGTVDITIEHDPSSLPPVIGQTALETITIKWAGIESGSTWSFSGGMTSYTGGATIGERMEASATITISGEISKS